MLACAPDSCVHGRCVNGSCICDSGWSGNVDLLTQDLSPANGPVLKCTSHILTLKIMYGFAAGLSFFVIVFSFVGLIQQWGKYKSMLEDRQLQHWYQHTPLAFLLLCFTLGAPSVLLVAIIKLSSDHLNETVGVTHMASWSRILTIWLRSGIGYLNCHTAYALIQKRFSSGGDVRKHRVMRALQLVHQLGAIAAVLCSVYPAVSVMTSSYAQRGVRELLFALFFGQRVCIYVVTSGAAAMIAFEARGYMDEVIETRKQAANVANVAHLIEEVTALQTTRRKILANFVSLSVVSGMLGIATAALLVIPDFKLYTSYFFAATDLLAILPTINSITSYTRLDCCFIRMQHPEPEPEGLSREQMHSLADDIGIDLSLRAQQNREQEGTPLSITLSRNRDGTDISGSSGVQRGQNNETQPVAGEDNSSSVAVPNEQTQEQQLSDDSLPLRPRVRLYTIAELTA
mmetsp:Transcript_26349/g.55285  ORF Transcript_26349/g.55285 Transcript_26349/m.55285 type:complete len:458 (+) Transcript_26349:25-1398(+)|eukprot:4203364-Pleurochrysis_carterae.AAC.1